MFWDKDVWSFNGFFGWDSEIRLERGVFDEDARAVFCRGHCHSLALALEELIPGSELRAAWTGEAEPDHIYVRLPDGRYLDGNGVVETEEEILERMSGRAHAEEIDEEEIYELEWREAYRERRVKDAKPFARALIEREGIDTRELAAA